MWRVIPSTSKSRRRWAALDAEDQQQVERELSEYPERDPRYRKARKHIKGKIRDLIARCHWEYRRLGAARYIYYQVDHSKREIRIRYIGPHL